MTGSADTAHHYMTYMNVFFTAQKERVVLDICALDDTLVLLQQGCDITGGQVRVLNNQSLLSARELFKVLLQALLKLIFFYYFNNFSI